MNVLEAIAAWFLGGAAYVLLELLWRGRSHVSMFFAGGTAFLLLHGLFQGPLAAAPLALACLAGALVITSVEFVAGVVVNLRLKLAVWDYSHMPMQLYGQICLPFSLLWGLLTIPIVQVSQWLGSLDFLI